MLETDLVYIRFIGDRSVDEKDFGKVQRFSHLGLTGGKRDRAFNIIIPSKCEMSNNNAIFMYAGVAISLMYPLWISRPYLDLPQQRAEVVATEFNST